MASLFSLRLLQNDEHNIYVTLQMWNTCYWRRPTFQHPRHSVHLDTISSIWCKTFITAIAVIFQFPLNKIFFKKNRILMLLHSWNMIIYFDIIYLQPCVQRNIVRFAVQSRHFFSTFLEVGSFWEQPPWQQSSPSFVVVITTTILFNLYNKLLWSRGALAGNNTQFKNYFHFSMQNV